MHKFLSIAQMQIWLLSFWVNGIILLSAEGQKYFECPLIF